LRLGRYTARNHLTTSATTLSGFVLHSAESPQDQHTFRRCFTPLSQVVIRCDNRFWSPLYLILIGSGADQPIMALQPFRFTVIQVNRARDSRVNLWQEHPLLLNNRKLNDQASAKPLAPRWKIILRRIEVLIAMIIATTGTHAHLMLVLGKKTCFGKAGITTRLPFHGCLESVSLFSQKCAPQRLHQNNNSHYSITQCATSSCKVCFCSTTALPFSNGSPQTECGHAYTTSKP